jgi:hypothetical protein
LDAPSGSCSSDHELQGSVLLVLAELLCELDFALRLPHARFGLRVEQEEEVVQGLLLPLRCELLACA